MWRPCETVLDKPVTLWIFHTDDLVCFFVVAVATGVVCDLLGSVLIAAGATAGLYRLKRGKPAGFLRHSLHRWGLVPIPGVLSRHPTTYKAW